MFIKNKEGINRDRVVLVDYPIKRYLEKLGYSPVGRINGQWAFSKCPEILNILSRKKGGYQDE